MSKKYHWNVKLIDVQDRLPLMDQLIKRKYSSTFQFLENEDVYIISQKTIVKFIDEELIHDNTEMIQKNGQLLHTMSSGERKRAFLSYILDKNPSLIILDHFFDNIDQQAKQHYIELLNEKSNQLSIINIYTRERDNLPYLPTNYDYADQELVAASIQKKESSDSITLQINQKLPVPIRQQEVIGEILIDFKNVNVAYQDKKILHNINWRIEKNQFWHLYGPNGSGKTTLLSMINGDNPKAYGQKIHLFGKLKGTGESIWDIKQKVGYFTTNMTFQFKRMQSMRNMVISGFFDSIGLYNKAGDQQIKIANDWLDYIGLAHLADQPFIKMSLCHQRMVMIARAMVKHPPLLILDEPSVDLDDASAILMTDLINRIAKEGNTTIIYVSHRMESGLYPTHGFELKVGENGSIGVSTKN